jgi:hypothetical protein
VLVPAAAWAAVAINSLAIGAPRPSAPNSARLASPAPGHELRPLAELEPEIRAWVEGARELNFRRTVRLEALSSADFLMRFSELVDDEVAPPDYPGEEVFRALGLLDPDNPPFGFGAVPGFYDDRAAAVVVSARFGTPLARAVLAHELAHAVVDQHTPLRPLFLDGLDGNLAGRALIEGDASRVEKDFVADVLTASERATLPKDDPTGRLVRAGGSAGVVALAHFPYVQGEQFVRALHGGGGVTAVDAAFRRPPTTTEQVLHPEKYAATEPAVAIPQPNTDAYRVTSDGTLGEFALSLALQRGLPAEDAQLAAAGWGGDYYFAWSIGGRASVSVSIVMDAPAERAQLVSALQRYRHDGRAATYEEEGEVVRVFFHE